MIIIDSDNYAASGIETMFFPGGEPHVKVPPGVLDPNRQILFFVKLRTWNDVGIAMCVLSAIQATHRYFRTKVFIPYFPGARQDHPSAGTPHTVKLIADLLLRYRNVQYYVFDPHSPELQEVAPVWPCSFGLEDLLVPAIPGLKGILVPDEGARERAGVFRDAHYPDVPLIQCTKIRDPHTGELSNYQIEDVPMVGGNYLVVDDICDGGGTFNLLVEAFRARTGWSFHYHLHLVVSHGIFSKGLEAISGAYETITTTDSFCKAEACKHRRLTVIPLLEQLRKRITGEKA